MVSTTFNPATVIAAVDARGRVTRRVTVPGYGPLNSADDLTVGPDGVAYVTLNAAGRIVRVDLDSGPVLHHRFGADHAVVGTFRCRAGLGQPIAVRDELPGYAHPADTTMKMMPR